MISAEKARKSKELPESKTNWELSCLDKAIKKLSLTQESLTLSTGLTGRAYTEQNLLYPYFKGQLEQETVDKLRELGYKVEWGSSYQDSWTTITWGV